MKLIFFPVIQSLLKYIYPHYNSQLEDQLPLFSADDLISEAELRPFTPTTTTASENVNTTVTQSPSRQNITAASTANNTVTGTTTMQPMFSIPSPRVASSIVQASPRLK